jgi:hypothetical protein
VTIWWGKNLRMGLERDENFINFMLILSTFHCTTSGGVKINANFVNLSLILSIGSILR